MVETEISQNTKTNYGRNRTIIEYKNKLQQKQKYHTYTNTNYGRNRNIIQYKNKLRQKQKYHRIQKRIMVETGISYNTKTNYGRNRNII